MALLDARPAFLSFSHFKESIVLVHAHPPRSLPMLTPFGHARYCLKGLDPSDDIA